MEETEYWEAVCRRDKKYEGAFVYAVRSTGIYCRPSCPSRRPRREYVQFFGSPAGAEQAGYRACRRCQPDKPTPDEPNLALVQRMCRYLSEPRDEIPTLDELGAGVPPEFVPPPTHLQADRRGHATAIRGGSTHGKVQDSFERRGIRDRCAL